MNCLTLHPEADKLDSIFVTVVVIIVSIAAFFLFMGMSSRYHKHKNQYGISIAQRLLVKEIIEIIILALLAVIVFLIVGSEWDVFTITVNYLLAIVLWIWLLALVISRLNAGSTRFDFNKSDQSSGELVVWLLVYFGLEFIENLSDSRLEIRVIVELVVFALLVVPYLLRSKMKSFVTQKGVFANNYSVKWKQIKEYHWIASADATDWLLITVKGYPPLFDMRIASIPSSHKNSVNDLLTNQMSAITKSHPRSG
ncbi:MAG: hypothetical protein GY832_47250 [Chloroflexi bacterium]|nr:hypothetical protein [Chloroflexota bacterium]